jgi:hypothetical protein
LAEKNRVGREPEPQVFFSLRLMCKLRFFSSACFTAQIASCVGYNSGDKLYNRIMTDIIGLSYFVPGMAFVSQLSERNVDRIKYSTTNNKLESTNCQRFLKFL